MWLLDYLADNVLDVRLFPNQHAALCGILNIPQNEKKSLIVQRTGAGKTLIIQVLGAVLKGVILIVSPLLALTTNLAPRFASSNTFNGAIDAIHLDEDADCSIKITSLIDQLDKKQEDTNNTTFILCSPQYLVSHPSMNDALLRCLDSKVLRAIVCDEAHLLAQHGADFRDDIRAFSRTFLQPALKHDNTPYFVGLTATMSLSNLEYLEDLMGSKISDYGKIWDHWRRFMQQNIDMKFVCSNLYKSKAASIVTNFIKKRKADWAESHGDGFDTEGEAAFDKDNSAVAVFVNSRALAKDVTDAIETSLDRNECGDIDVVTVHGQLEKEEKFFNLTTFCSDDIVDGFDRQPSRVYTSTGSGDHGINHSDLRSEVICEWPENISVFHMVST
jgi:superfamily II DNA helicase RecQ